MPTTPEKLPHALLALYPALRSVPSEQLVMACQRMVRLPAGAQVCTESQHCLGLPLLLAGPLRVVKSTASGREIVLYRVEPGGSCRNG